MNYQQRTLKQKLATLSEVNTTTPAFTHNAKRAGTLHSAMRKKVAAASTSSDSSRKVETGKS